MGTFIFPHARVLGALLVLAGVTGCGGGSQDLSAAQVAAEAAAPVGGLKISDIKVGTGISPKPGQTCVVHYTGWLYVNGAKGAKFDSSRDRKQPFSFVLGQHSVIEGWEQGVSTMRVGGKRTLIVPPALGYGSRQQGTIPPNSTLLFEVELLDVKAPS